MQVSSIQNCHLSQLPWYVPSPKYRIDDYTFTIAQLPLLNPHHMHLVEANYLNYRHRFTAKPFLQLTKITYKPVIKSTDILLYPLHKVTI